MEKQTFLDANKQMHNVTDILEELMEGDAFASIRNALEQLSSRMESRFQVSLSTHAIVADKQDCKSLTLLRMELATSDGDPAAVRWDYAEPQGYIADGEMVLVPSDKCPRCWDNWDIKFFGRPCPTCKARMGVHVKALLDTNVCPICQEAIVMPNDICCNKCEFEIDPNFVTWG